MSKNEIALVTILLLLCLTLLFFRLGARPLWNIDEGKHASTSKDMVLSGDWVTPTLNGKNFYDKPILYNWLAALSFIIFGFTEFAARFPAALLGLGCAIITYLLGRRMFGPVVGFLGGVILVTSPEYVILSRAVVHDISLVFFVTLALFSFYLGFTSSDGHRKRCFLLFYVSLGFAVLAKGPVGVLLPALIIGLFLILRGRLRFLKQMQIGWGALVFLVVAAPWYILISLKNSDYAVYFFIQQNLMNFLASKIGHPQPFYYYIPILLGGFFPWSFFLPLALIRALRGRLKEVDDRVLFLVLWFAAVFLFFSVASSKLPTYILPSFPAAALLVAGLWHDLISAPTPELRKGFFYSYIPIAAILPLALVYILINPPAHVASESGIDLLRIHVMAFTIVGIASLSFLMFLKKHYKVFFSLNAVLVVSGVMLFIVLLVPRINPYRSSKRLAQELDVMTPPGEDLVFYRELRDTALFYTNRRARVLYLPKQLIEYMTSNKRAFCIIRKKHFQELDKLKEMSQVLDQEGKDLIISTRTSG